MNLFPPQTKTFRTKGAIEGVCSIRQEAPEHALDQIWANIDQHKGGLFVSNFEVPNRYARWDIGFIAPALEITLQKHRFFLRALQSGFNDEGERWLSALKEPLLNHAHLEHVVRTAGLLKGTIKIASEFLTEEERIRQPSFFTILRSILQQLHCDQAPLGLYGAFGYDLVHQFEPLILKQQRSTNQLDCCLFLPAEIVMVDRRKEQAFRYSYSIHSPLGWTRPLDDDGKVPSLLEKEGVGTLSIPPASSTLQSDGGQSQATSTADDEIHCDHEQGEFSSKVNRIREGCRAGDFFEVVLSQSFSAPYTHLSSQLFRDICQQNPSPYSFLINMGEQQLVGASPEMYVRVSGKAVETSPISGTVPTGNSAIETAAQIKALISSDKEEAELTMCTDVDRNDMTRVCVPGSVNLIGRRLLEQYSRLVHTVDHVKGELLDQYDALDAFAVHLWACTTTGAPKPAALQMIENLENSPRQWYGGAVGFLSANGDMNTGMTLRTVHLQSGRASVRAGATLLYHSDPAAEERESRIKASAFLDAVRGISAKKSAPAQPPKKDGTGKRVLLVDCKDSFVHTLASYFRDCGAEVSTVRPPLPQQLINDFKPHLIVLSPGPGTPKQMQLHSVIEKCLPFEIPLFGVCLGHQAIAEYFGGTIATLEEPMHGRMVSVQHDGAGLFTDLSSPLNAGLYHSLYVEDATLPNCLQVTARSAQGIIMGLTHRELPIASFQFHPESILTLEKDTGRTLINNLFNHLAS